MTEISESIRRGNEALKGLGLPSSKVIGDDKELIKHYAHIGQCLDAFIDGKNLTDYQLKFLPKSLTTFNTHFGEAIPLEPIDKASAQEWVSWLKTLPQLRDAINKNKEQISRSINKAPPLLRFLAELTKLQDTEALINATDSKGTSLSKLRSGPPDTPPNCKSAILVFKLPKGNLAGNKKSSHRILLAVWLAPRNDEVFNGALGPTMDSAMVLSTSEFFDRDGQPKGNYEVGTIAEVAGRDWSPKALGSWSGFLEELDSRCTELFGGPLHEFAQKVFGNFRETLEAHVIDADMAQPKLWSDVYQKLLNGEITSHTVSTALAGVEQPKYVSLATSPHESFLGNMDTRNTNGLGRSPPNSLDPTQRLAVIQSLVLKEIPGNCILAINGPPGTGKTSFLRAVLASQWVQAALDKAESPPIVLGTGATNKAVSNIIEAFSEVPGAESDIFEKRWVDGLPSYGWFFPSPTAAENNPTLMHLRKTEKNHYTPQAGASKFSETSIDNHLSTYIERARVAMQLSGPGNNELNDILENLHQRITKLVEGMHREQTEFRKKIEELPGIWKRAQQQASVSKTLSLEYQQIHAQIQNIDARIKQIQRAINAGQLYHYEASRLLTGVRSWLPYVVQDFFWGKGLNDLQAISQRAKAEFKVLNASWSTALPLLGHELTLLMQMTDDLLKMQKILINRSCVIKNKLDPILDCRKKRFDAWHQLSDLIRQGPGKTSTVRYARNLCVNDEMRRERAKDELWARFEARHDREVRIQLFHLAGRYWEGRWIQAQIIKGPVTDHEGSIRRLMMLGVIVVATTHKLCALGEKFTADLLVMDEAGQCSPEVGIGVLAFTKSAIFVGDTKQLQPIAIMTQQRAEKLAVSIGIDPADLPVEICPSRGSAMTVAQRASSVTDRSGDPGVTLLHHYRCHPCVIQYCNELLYEGRMVVKRSGRPSPTDMPPMSWVAVDGYPKQEGSSWVNEAEIEEIARWITDVHTKLTASYGLPLNEVLAIITPLAAQAQLAKKRLKELLDSVLGDGVIDKMTIGTVHRLQGAERPVVAFSLVQNRNLFADRDGGFLMNVAVSRAKDCFVIFASRETLNPAPSDEQRASKAGNGPIAQLVSYMRRKGTRLYPRNLVVVEAPGKVLSVQKALGLNVAVVATRGYLRKSRLLPEGTLRWDDDKYAKDFIAAIIKHNGFIDKLYIATDDDIAGELIGMQAAEIVAENLPTDITVRRMRFYSTTKEDLKLAFDHAGTNFDADFLAAALVREFARHIDNLEFTRLMKGTNYVSASRRDIVALTSELCKDQRAQVHAEVQDKNGTKFLAFVPERISTMARPKFFEKGEAEAIAKSLTNKEIYLSRKATVFQVPDIYPSSTTPRILAVVADELGITPWDAQDHLNALYQEGAR